MINRTFAESIILRHFLNEDASQRKRLAELGWKAEKSSEDKEKTIHRHPDHQNHHLETYSHAGYPIFGFVGGVPFLKTDDPDEADKGVDDDDAPSAAPAAAPAAASSAGASS